MRVMSTASFAENEPTRAFQTARVFHPVPVCLYRPGTFITRLVRRLLSLSCHPPPRSGCGGRQLQSSRAREGKIDGKISVKCQFALNIWNFCEKGECGALAMILLNRLSRLEGPDVLWLLRKSGRHTDMSQAQNKRKFFGVSRGGRSRLVLGPAFWP